MMRYAALPLLLVLAACAPAAPQAVDDRMAASAPSDGSDSSGMDALTKARKEGLESAERMRATGDPALIEAAYEEKGGMRAFSIFEEEVAQWTFARFLKATPGVKWSSPADATWTEDLPSMNEGRDIPAGTLKGKAINARVDLEPFMADIEAALGQALWQEYWPARAEGTHVYYLPWDGVRFLFVVDRGDMTAVLVTDPVLMDVMNTSDEPTRKDAAR